MSVFQAENASFESEAQQAQAQQAQAQQQTEAPKNPLLEKIQPIVQKAQEWSQTPQDIPLLWKFISMYLTFLERSPQMMTFIHKAYGNEIGNNLIEALKNVHKKPFENVTQVLFTINSIPGDDENLTLFKLNIQGQSVLQFVANGIQSLPPEPTKQLNDLFLSEMKKYDPVSATDGTSFFSKKFSVPGTGMVLECKYIILIVVLLLVLGLGGLYYFKDSIPNPSSYGSAKKTKVIEETFSDGDDSSVLSG